MHAVQPQLRARPDRHAAQPGPGTSPRRWDASTLGSAWQHRIPDAALAEFIALVGARPSLVDDLDGFVFSAERLPELAAFAARIRGALLHEDGVAWLRGLRESGLDPAAWKLFYVAMGCAIGAPMTQYGRIYAVKDRGQSHLDNPIPVSMTRATTGFHTDSSARRALPEVIGLLCERPATVGGESMISNALTAYQNLNALAPEALRLLRRGYIRDVVTPGVERSLGGLLDNQIPVFAASPGGRLVFRYMRYWIERGHKNAGIPLTRAQLRAFDLLDDQLWANAVRFRMEAGDVLWLNNCALAHNRAAYDDAPGNTRLLHRMWLQLSPVQH